ncbi:hypothetical protein HNR42_000990 [Deinobacterium chartae]|uniref:Uncharacterized protein n=1 Tax=Deinobacterium chartae TaxID=521158 RepID=A0A841HXI9_9DEIO|nr:hypothetical protein [Deinobacterium chartae]MBB6097573.1 hypothetical protein [Deinobacterium chartae]
MNRSPRLLPTLPLTIAGFICFAAGCVILFSSGGDSAIGVILAALGVILLVLALFSVRRR